MSLTFYTMTVLFGISIYLYDITICSNTEKSLFDMLFANYSKNIRPIHDYNEQMTVSLCGRLIQILSVNEKTQAIKIKVWFRMEWEQDVLKWDPHSWDGIESLQVSPDMIWLPGITSYTSIQKDKDSLPSHFTTDVVLQANGKNGWFSPATFESTCAMSVIDFPFDVQECELGFTSWLSTIDMLNLDVCRNFPVITEDYIENSEWHVEDAHFKRLMITEKDEFGLNEQYAEITLYMKLQRKPLYHVLNTIAPCFILIGLMLMTFYLPPNSGERMGLTVTLFLSVTVFQQLVSESLPENSDSFPRLTLFFIFVILLGSLSVCTSCFVIRMQKQSESSFSRPVPLWIRKMCLLKDCNLKCESPRQSSVECNDNCGLDTENGVNNVKVIKEFTTTVEQTVPKARIDMCGFTCLPIELQWRIASEHLDIAFFWIFLSTSIIAVLVLILPSYVKSL